MRFRCWPTPGRVPRRDGQTFKSIRGPRRRRKLDTNQLDSYQFSRRNSKMKQNEEQDCRQLNSDLHAFGRCSYFRIVIAGVVHDLVDYNVGVVGIVVEEHKLFRAAFHDDIDRLAPVAVAPATFFGSIFFRQVLGVVDQHIRSLGQLADALIEGCVPRFIVSGVNQHAIFGFHPEAHAALRVIEPRGLNLDSVFQVQPATIDVVKLLLRLHLAEIDGEVGGGHLLVHYLLQAADAARAMKKKLAVGTVIQWTKEWNALDVVPVKVRNEDVSGQGELLLSKFVLQLLPQNAKAGATIKNVKLFADAHLDAGGIAAIAHVFRLRGRRGTTHAPKLDSHRLQPG